MMSEFLTSIFGDGAMWPTVIALITTVLGLVFGSKWSLARRELKELGKELAEAINKSVNMPDKPTQQYLNELKKEWLDVAAEAKDVIAVFKTKKDGEK